MSVANPSTPKEDEDKDDSQVAAGGGGGGGGARRRSPPLAQAVPLVLLPFRLSLLTEHPFRSLELRLHPSARLSFPQRQKAVPSIGFGTGSVVLCSSAELSPPVLRPLPRWNVARAWENEEPASEKPRKKASKGSAALGLLEGLLVDKGVGRCLPAIAPGLMGRCWRMRQRHGGRRRRGRLGAGLLLHACCPCEGITISVPWALKVPVDQLKGVCVCVCVLCVCVCCVCVCVCV